MNTLTSDQIRWNYRCGLDRRFLIRMRVMQYADLSLTAQEYKYFYNGLSAVEKQIADALIEDIAEATDLAMLGN